MLLASVAAALALGACAGERTEQVDGGRVMSFEKADVRIVTGRDTVVVKAEIARSASSAPWG